VIQSFKLVIPSCRSISEILGLYTCRQGAGGTNYASVPLTYSPPFVTELSDMPKKRQRRPGGSRTVR
jgi:hypothetical protein